jgi:hypothetical protein
MSSTITASATITTHKASSTTNIEKTASQITSSSKENNQHATVDDDMSFLDVLSKIQSNRLDDQRCSIRVRPQVPPAPLPPSLNQEQTKKSNSFKELTNSVTTNTLTKKKQNMNDKSNEDFFNQLMKAQGSRLEDQRSSLATIAYTSINKNIKQASTIPPDDGFFNMVQSVHSKRLNEQKSSIKSLATQFKNATSSVVKSVLSHDKPLRN